MSIVSSIQSNFRTLMSADITGSASASWTEYPRRIDINHWDTVPLSVRDGAWSLVFNGNSEPTLYHTPDIDVIHNVVLQLSFALSKNDLGTRYAEALHDIEVILRARLNPTSYAGYNNTILNIEHVSTSPFNFVNDNEKVAVVELEFQVTGRTTVI